ncbi:MAG: hypothetical protein COB96_04765 [Planctomycetota bacterium]|nr:MAG: hypothetical protein COB96_04765 [Planctomycetota bacterium]
MNKTIALASLLLICPACQQQGWDGWESPQTDNEYARIAEGRGIASHWGILFEVEEPGEGGVSSSAHDQAGFPKPEDNWLIRTTNLGEVTIVLEKRGSAPIALSINGKSYPAKVGDTFFIDKARNVVVNEY